MFSHIKRDRTNLCLASVALALGVTSHQRHRPDNCILHTFHRCWQSRCALCGCSIKNPGLVMQSCRALSDCMALDVQPIIWPNRVVNAKPVQ
eukprot:309993-Amphidinium_carterae.1